MAYAAAVFSHLEEKHGTFAKSDAEYAPRPASVMACWSLSLQEAAHFAISMSWLHIDAMPHIVSTQAAVERTQPVRHCLIYMVTLKHLALPLPTCLSSLRCNNCFDMPESHSSANTGSNQGFCIPVLPLYVYDKTHSSGICHMMCRSNASHCV